jgi:hypothetical protein
MHEQVVQRFDILGKQAHGILLMSVTAPRRLNGRAGAKFQEYRAFNRG